MRFILTGPNEHPCCHVAAIRDTSKPVKSPEGKLIYYEIVCEFRDREWAERLLNILNQDPAITYVESVIASLGRKS